VDITKIAASSYKRAAWKNGLGYTDEIAIHPEGASLREGNFLWRVSSARIEKASPFSEFPHHDRVLVVIEGGGVRLAHTFEPGEEPERVELPRLEVYEFPGEVPSRCELIEGAVTDLSVFVRKGEAEASVEVWRPKAESEWAAGGHWNFAFVVEGEVEIAGERLGRGETASVERAAPGGEPVRLSGSGTAVLIEIVKC
jgi:uncharacterized protein